MVFQGKVRWKKIMFFSVNYANDYGGADEFYE